MSTTPCALRSSGKAATQAQVFSSADLFKVEGATAGLPLEEMRRYIRALEITNGRKCKMVLAEPGCSYIKVEMPVYVPPDAETLWKMRSWEAFANPEPHMHRRPCRDFEQMRPPDQYPQAEPVATNSKEGWKQVKKSGKHN